MSTSHFSPRTWGAVLSIIFLSLLVVPFAAAQSAESSTAASATAQSSDAGPTSDKQSKVALVMDASFSMADPESEGGPSKMQVAKDATNQLVDKLPDSALVGAVAYGSKESNAPDNKERGCQDISVLSPVGRIDKAGLKDSFNALEPKGYTPIGNSLKKAAEQLKAAGGEGENSIVLVSDGIDTCAPPPVCEVAKELAADGVGLTVHTIGFQVDEKAQSELDCVAEVTGGQSLAAANAAELAQNMEFLTLRSVNMYEAKGTPFEFADDPDSAKYLGEGTYHTKVLPRMGRNEGEDRPFYTKLSVPEGYNAYVTVFAIPEQNAEGKETSDIFSTVEAENPAPNCEDYATRVQSIPQTTLGSRYTPPYSASVLVQNEKQPEDEEDRCIKMDDWDIVTTLHFSDTISSDPVNQDVELDVEVNVQYVKAGAFAGDEKRPYASRELPEVKQIEEGAPVAGGATFDSAAAVTPGETYSDAIVDGEYRFYKFDVPYGKRPVVTVQGRKSVAEHQGYNLRWDFYNPTRGSVLAGGDIYVGNEEEVERSAGDSAVQWANRTEYVDAPLMLPGTYYLVFAKSVNENASDRTSGMDQGYSFKVELDGEPMDGPEFTPNFEPGAEPSDTPINLASASEDLDKASETTKAEDAPKEGDNAEQQSADADVAQAGEDSAGGSNLKGMLIGAGVVLLIAVGAAGGFLLARRK